MPANAVAENVFGTMGRRAVPPPRNPQTLLKLTHSLSPAGAIFWTVQLIPQLLKTWRTKSTEGLSPWLV
jgi:hypothetical protein